MVVVELSGVALCFGLNLLMSHKGHTYKEDKELFLPPTSVIFLFYPIIIAIPEAHYKLMNYSLKDNSSIDEQELFPYAFLISLISITLSVVVDKFLLADKEASQQESGLHRDEDNWHKHKNTLQFLLTLSISLQNVVNYYYICVQPNGQQQIKEILLFLLFSLLINFSHGIGFIMQGISQGRLELMPIIIENWPS